MRVLHLTRLPEIELIMSAKKLAEHRAPTQAIDSYARDLLDAECRVSGVEPNFKHVECEMELYRIVRTKSSDLGCNMAFRIVYEKVSYAELLDLFLSEINRKETGDEF